MFETARRDSPGRAARGGVRIGPRAEPYDAASMMEALGLLLVARGKAGAARFDGACVDSKGRVALWPSLPPAVARLERVRALRAARGFAALLEAAGIPATLMNLASADDAQVDGTGNS